MITVGNLCLGGATRAEPSAGFPLPPEEQIPPPAAAPARPPAPRPPAPPPQALPTAREPLPHETADTSTREGEPARSLPPPSGYPLVLPYRDGMPVPRGYHVEHRASNGLTVTGGITLGVGYLTALGIGLHYEFENGTGWTALPVIGPWAAIGARDFDCDVNGIDGIDTLDDVNTEQTANEAERCIRRAQSEALAIALLAVDGMIQATGAILVAAGLASGVDELVWDGLADVHVSARARPEGGGELKLFGTF